MRRTVPPPASTVTAPASLLEAALVDELAACRPRLFAIGVASREQGLSLLGRIGPRLGARVLRSSLSLETPGARLIAVAEPSRLIGVRLDRAFIPEDVALAPSLAGALTAAALTGGRR